MWRSRSATAQVFITTNSTLTVYDSGKVVLKCNGDGAGSTSLTYFTFANTGITCGMLQFGSTTDWVDKVGRQRQLAAHRARRSLNADAASASGGGAGLG